METTMRINFKRDLEEAKDVEDRYYGARSPEERVTPFIISVVEPTAPTTTVTTTWESVRLAALQAARKGWVLNVYL